MENPDKPPRAEAKLKNLDEDQLQVLWDLRYKDSGKINKTLRAITLSRFYTWLRLKREWEEDAAIADQAKNEWLQERPDATAEDLMRVGQLKFTAQSIKRGDDKAFVRLMRAITAREKAATDREKAADARLTKVEAGLDALYQEIQGNAAALKAYHAMKEALKQ
ncbi:MAG: hypothetical protein MUF31_16785 [Akkermansiaceae bacterium]|nr:hypothetical protein [Akkermansiaceae bacterium]